MEQKPNRRKQQQTRMIVVAVIVVLALIAAILHLTTGRVAQGEDTRGELSADNAGEEVTTLKSSNKSIVYDGKTYDYNDHLSNYLLIGVDTDGSIQEEKGIGEAGQSDWLMLISYDRAEEKAVAIGIPRETLAMIEKFSLQGESTGLSRDFLTLQYSYGEGKQKSCQLTAEAVSRLLNGIPVDGYAAINTSSIPELTELVGGVDVVIPNDSLVYKDPALQKGTELHLDSTNTELFVRSRDTSENMTTSQRRERQKVFVDAFATKLAQEQKKEPSTVTRLYEKLKPEMVTTMSNDIFVKLAGAERTGGVQTIPGESTHEGDFDVYHVDDAELYKMVIETFYKEKP